jgi:hypothetical protein
MCGADLVEIRIQCLSNEVTKEKVEHCTTLWHDANYEVNLRTENTGKEADDYMMYEEL